MRVPALANFFAVLFCSVTCSQITSAQNPTTTVPTAVTAESKPVQDAQALAAIQRAILALGGAANGQVKNATVQGTILITSETPNQNATFVWKDDWSGNQPAYRREFQQGSSTGVLVSGNGSPTSTQDGKTESVPGQTSLAYVPIHLPGVALAGELNNPSYDLKYLGTSEVNGLPAIKVQTSVSRSKSVIAAILSEQVWYFDSASGLPVHLEYRITSDKHIGSPRTASVDYANYRQFAGVLVPVQMIEHGLSGEEDTVTVTSVSLNAGVNPSDFLVTGN
jgi:hypothetical protein